MKDPHGFEQKSDEEIMLLAQERKEFFDVLTDRYEMKLIRYAMHVGAPSKEAAEDIVQSSLLKAYTHRKSFAQGKKFSSWVYGIVHHECIDVWRKDGRHPTISLEVHEELASVLPSGDDLEEAMILKEEIAEAHRYLHLLPIQYREVLVLRYLEEKNYKEIAEILKKPVSTVGTLLRRAKKAVKDIFSKEHETVVK